MVSVRSLLEVNGIGFSSARLAFGCGTDNIRRIVSRTALMQESNNKTDRV
jgi:hypothetical protein